MFIDLDAIEWDNQDNQSVEGIKTALNFRKQLEEEGYINPMAPDEWIGRVITENLTQIDSKTCGPITY